MFTKLLSMGVWGIDAYPVEVETSSDAGMPSFDIVGLPDAAVKESRDRVRSAVKNSGFAFPSGHVIVNLAPADIKKEGSVYDLPILLGVLLASEYITFDAHGYAFVGELSLSGEVKPVKGLLSMAICAKREGLRGMFVPAEIAQQAAVVEGIDIFPVKNAAQLLSHLLGMEKIEPVRYDRTEFERPQQYADFADVAGQEFAKRAIEIAAAGGHNILMIGPPGSGKSMLAKRIPSILPEMTFDEAIEVSSIHSVAGILPKDTPVLTERPFRSPHHTVSAPALAGGGSNPVPGEISLAHNGVLFLDELPEFPRIAMETLRQPLEDGVVNISRVMGTVSYPCRAMFVAAMNPCPCGYYGHETRKCSCSENGVRKYLSKISGPMLDRMDIHIEVPAVKYDELAKSEKSECSAEIRKRVNEARKIQQQRYSDYGISCNAQLTTPMLKKFCRLDDAAGKYLKLSFERLSMSGRAYDRILKVARTIADLEKSESITRAHIAQSIALRSLDRKYWSN